MASKSFIPAPNGEFNNWQENFVNNVNTYLNSWQLSADAIDEWNKLISNTSGKKKRWDDSWAVVKTREFRHSEQIEMRAARKNYEYGKKNIPTDTSLRIFITRYLRNNPKVSTFQKTKMGLTVPVSSKSPTSEKLIKSENALLSGYVKFGMHLIHFCEVNNPRSESKAKADGVENIQIFIAFTEALQRERPDMSCFNYDGVVKYGKYKRIFTPAQEGLRAWYYARIMLKGNKSLYGPPSVFWSSLIM